MASDKSPQTTMASVLLENTAHPALASGVETTACGMLMPPSPARSTSRSSPATAIVSARPSSALSTSALQMPTVLP